MDLPWIYHTAPCAHRITGYDTHGWSLLFGAQPPPFFVSVSVTLANLCDRFRQESRRVKIMDSLTHCPPQAGKIQ